MARLTVPEAEALLDQHLPVLGGGFVRLVDYLGSDARVAEAARVSYAGTGTKSVRSDEALIDYLLRHSHTSPFEQVVLTFHLRVPVFVARQWLRHRTGRVNEISARYSELEDAFYEPELERYRQQGLVNKQGSAVEGLAPEARERAAALVEEAQVASYAAYRELLALGVAREVAIDRPA